MNKQEKAYNLFHKQQEKNRVSHAYLVVGKSDAFSFAKYMAKSLMCEKQAVGACGTCVTCERIEANQHGDYKLVSSRDESIKKQEIVELKEYFKQTTMEANGHKVYILEDVDQASIAALNSILKFLEEPDSDITAILTTSQQNRVLETVQSRCMIIQLEAMHSMEIIEESMQLGIPQDDARLLAQFIHSTDALKTTYEDVRYQSTKDIVVDFLSHLNAGSIHEATVGLQVEAIKQKKIDKDNIQLFFDLLIASLEDTVGNVHISALSVDQRLTYKKIFMMLRDRIRPGINTNLLMDQIVFEIYQLAQKSFTI